VELWSGQPFPRVGELPYLLTLGPHNFLWFRLVQADRVTEVQELANVDFKAAERRG
ncbi:MAG: alpha-glucosidase C-terminal domain-containing protein, partial [Gemmatimonadaceae bacterium]|nr:alpha-glucosidase C-terminal domain-containing protein [Gemmatimonadaceae bacterium]